MSEGKPMTAGQLRELLPERGSPEYNLPVKVYAAKYMGCGVDNLPIYDKYKEGDFSIDSVVKVSELTKPEKDFFRIEIA